MKSLVLQHARLCVKDMKGLIREGEKERALRLGSDTGKPLWQPAD